MASLGLMAALVFADQAEARRGGGFGSRGARTFQAIPPTQTAPRQAAPIDRSMQPRSPAMQHQNARPMNQTAGRQGLFGGFGRSLLGGLVLGGLIGMLLGHGMGGLAGFAGLLLQLGLLAVGAMLLMRFLARRRESAPATAGAPAYAARAEQPSRFDFRRDAFGGSLGGLAGTNPTRTGPNAGRTPSDEVGITDEDLDAFETLLQEIQSAFSREDYDALRQRTTPEIMSFLSQELGQNASQGLHNDVSDVQLLQGDLSEAWREDGADYATVAMRYSSIDATRERDTGRMVDGSEQPTETTEVWTFTRPLGGAWKLSAIQDI